MNVTHLRTAVSRFKKYGGVVACPVLQHRRLAPAMAVGALILPPQLSGDPEEFELERNRDRPWHIVDLWDFQYYATC